jgi:hypothetical protein
MEKSQIMMLVVVMAICCFSCISSVTIGAGISGGLDNLNNQQEENLEGGGIREQVVKACNTCKQNNWEGTTGVGADVPCSDLKEETCDEILGATS